MAEKTCVVPVWIMQVLPQFFCIHVKLNINGTFITGPVVGGIITLTIVCNVQLGLGARRSKLLFLSVTLDTAARRFSRRFWRVC